MIAGIKIYDTFEVQKTDGGAWELFMFTGISKPLQAWAVGAVDGTGGNVSFHILDNRNIPLFLSGEEVDAKVELKPVRVRGYRPPTAE